MVMLISCGVKSSKIRLKLSLLKNIVISYQTAVINMNVDS